jgi:disulfide bond formation protein DsbB
MNLQTFFSPNRLTVIWTVAALWLLILLLKSNEAVQMRGSQPQTVAQAPVVAPTTAPEATPTALPTAAPANPPAAAAASSGAGDAEKGKALFATTCAACHGPTGEGVTGLGKDMTTSEFVVGLSDEELLTFIKTGRSISDPLNTTKVDMPPKGGNPALQDVQIVDIIAFIRSIHKP